MKINKSKLIHVLLAVGGSIGVVGTAILSSKATLKADEKIKKIENEENTELTVKEKVENTWTNYIPAVATGGLTLVCIWSSTVFGIKEQSALLGSYILVKSKYNEFMEKTKEIAGSETFKQIEESIHAEKTEDVFISRQSIFGEGNSEAFETLNPSSECLFYDEYSQRFFKSTKYKVLNAEYHLNRNFAISGSTSLKMYYDFLGLTHTNEDSYWYVCDEYMWVDFSHIQHETKNGDIYYSIMMDFPPEPEPFWEEYA